jgi:hypothetical protein
MGLRLPQAKVPHIDEVFNFVGFRIVNTDEPSAQRNTAVLDAFRTKTAPI